MLLEVDSVDRRKNHFVVFESDEPLDWTDMPAKDLGALEQPISGFAVMSVNGREARGRSSREFFWARRASVGWDLLYAFAWVEDT